MKISIILLLISLNLSAISQSAFWTESKLKEHWNNKSIDEIEGIYEDASYPYYKLGLIKDSNDYKLIFLSIGTKDREFKRWKEGDIKGILKPTASQNIFTSTWYMVDKEPTQRYTIVFETGLLKLLTTSLAGNEIYLKTYPTKQDFSTPANENKLVSGTGFAISSTGIIVTNYHVIDGAKSVKVRGVNSEFAKTLNAKIVIADKNNDLALIQIDDASFTSIGKIPYTIKTTLSGVGENIFVLGYPLRATMGDEIKLTNGIISSKTGFQGDITSYQISAPIQPGNSGGPLFDSQGSLIGIVNAKHRGAENASYAIKASYLINLIELLPTSLTLVTENTLTNMPLTNQVGQINKFVFIIEVN